MRKVFHLLLLVGLLSCGQKNGDINRVLGPYFEKQYFNSEYKTSVLGPDEWYFRSTVTDTPTNTEAASIASGHWLHPELVRFEITENFLIAWRSYAAVPGSENDLAKGAKRDYRGEPVAVFRITDHFDIQREYDPATMERSNVIGENHDRTWDNRSYIRVDFSRNLVSQMKRQDPHSSVWSSESLDTDTAYAVGQNDPANPKRSRVESNYFEVTTRQGIKPDFYGFVGGYGSAYRYDNASPVVDIRFSFQKKSASDYESLDIPNTMVLKENGKELRDEKGFVKTEKIWERFGFYRASFSGQQQWDLKRGSTESGKNYNITRFNIWKKTYQNGQLIPIEARETKPIVYYTNVEHPDALLAASQKVASEWDLVFRELVFYAQPGKYATILDVPQMWVLHENSCNVGNVKSWLERIEKNLRKTIEDQAGFRVEDIQSRIASANDKNSTNSFTDRHNLESQAKADLERVCSALEYHTQSQPEKFVYQRSGDLRFNLMNLITKQAQTSWSGLGPMLADPITGEIIQAQANVNLWYIDRRAAWASRQIDAMNGHIDLNDLLFGNDIKAAMAEKMADLRDFDIIEPSMHALKIMDDRFYELSQKDSLLVEISPNHVQNRMSAILTPEMESRFLNHEYDHGQQNNYFTMIAGRENASSTELASPKSGHDLVARFLKKEEEQAERSMYPVDPPEMIDPLVIGLAIKYRDLNSRERFEKIREAIYTAVMLHEIGHNMGLAHNMAASSDALNYGQKFWAIQDMPRDLAKAGAQAADEATRSAIETCLKSSNGYPITTQECLGQDEIMYSSIMDYHAAWNSDLGGLGAYDKAAIKFGYAQLVETFPRESLLVDPNKQKLSRWIFLNDWKKIPRDFVRDVASISSRTHEKYRWQAEESGKPYPLHAVPYKYCLDSSGKHGPNCKAFDFGPDMRSQAKWNEVNYWTHYYFTNFAHDRVLTTDFDLESIVSRDLQIMSDYGKIMRWYYFLRATDAEFVGSDAEKDYLAATVFGLNHFAHIYGHPASGQHATVPLFVAEKSIDLRADDNRLDPSSILFPWSRLESCVQGSVAQVTQKVPVAAKPGYTLSNIKIGDGRPFYMGLTGDYEESYISHVGSFYSKMYAGYFLSTPNSWFPRTDDKTDPRSYAINWYRLFPKEVGKLFHDIIMEDWAQIGPVIDNSGRFRHRDLLDPITLQAPDYTNLPTVMPGVSTFLPYRSMLYAATLLSGNKTPELEPVKSMNVSLAGGMDDNRTVSLEDEEMVAVFKHPITGSTYKARKVGEYPIAFNLLKRVNITKDRFERLNRCVNDDVYRGLDQFCYCVKTAVERSNGSMVCCDPKNPLCPKITLAKIGEGTCSLADLRNRRDIEREKLNQEVGVIDDMRWLYENHANIP